MTPDERQLLSGLFDRMNNAAQQPRDREAESFITDRVRAQPYAPYLLSQTVIVQEQALRAAAEKIQELESQLGANRQAPQGEETSFLGNIGRSIFGGSAAQQPQRQAAPQQGGAPWGGQQGYAPPQQQQGGPWGGQGGQGFGGMQAPQGGGFLKGALGAAAGVAGGVLAADALRGLFGGHNNPFGIASGGFGGPGGETVVNNYYENDQGGGNDLAAQDAQQDFLQDQSDDFADNSFDSGDDSYNV